MADDPRGKHDDGKLLYCSFCGKSQHEVRKLIAGPSVFICDECVELCNDIIREELEDKSEPGKSKLPRPHEINAVLDQYVIGQAGAKRVLAVAVYNHYKRLESRAGASDRNRGDEVELAKSNILLIGPTGCGKTLLAETVCGLRAPDAGRVLLDGRDVTRLDPARRNIGYVPQDYALLPFKTVERNVAFGLEARRLPKREIRNRVGEMLELLGISYLATRYPAHLSGGERQRVALGRALAVRPHLLVMDEPLSALDEGTCEELMDLLRTLRDELNTTTLHICHRLEEAFALGDKLALLRDGALEQLAPPRELLNRPASLFVARFLRLPNVVQGEVRETPEGRTFFVGEDAWTPTAHPPGPAHAVVPLEALTLSLAAPEPEPGVLALADVIAENRPEALRPCLRFNKRLNFTVPGVFPPDAWHEGRTVHLAFPRDKVHVLPNGTENVEPEREFDAKAASC